MNRIPEKIGKLIRIKVDEEKCMGCEMCIMGCAARHSGQKHLPVCYPQSWRLLADEKLSMNLWELSQGWQLCQGCTDTPCVTICPAGAVRVLEVGQIPSRPRDQHLGKPKEKAPELSVHA